jgi:hypothetical protein
MLMWLGLGTGCTRSPEHVRLGASTRVLSEVHGRQILSLEKWMGIDVELRLRNCTMPRAWFLVFFNKWVLPPS